jgi:hypothetical protein
MREGKSVKKDHPEWDKERKMEKAAEKCRPDLPPWWLKQMAR